MKVDDRCDFCGSMIATGYGVERDGGFYHPACAERCTIKQEQTMGHHLTEDGRFKSDKYLWCEQGFFPLKFTDKKARVAIFVYAMLTDDPELSADLLDALKNEGVGGLDVLREPTAT